VARDEVLPGRRGAPPAPVRAAGALVGLQGLAAAAFAVLLAVGARSSPMGAGAVLAEAGFFLLIAVTLGAVGVGLATGRRGARTPALVTQILLLPVVYSLLSSGQTLLGVLGGVVVFAAFMLLINERSRAWSMGG
jgi:hypothetical protein